MPAFVKTKEDERLWEKAKGLAEDAGKKENWAYITGIYKNMKGGKVGVDPDYEFKTGPNAKSAASRVALSLPATALIEGYLDIILTKNLRLSLKKYKEDTLRNAGGKGDLFKTQKGWRIFEDWLTSHQSVWKQALIYYKQWGEIFRKVRDEDLALEEMWEENPGFGHWQEKFISDFVTFEKGHRRNEIWQKSATDNGRRVRLAYTRPTLQPVMLEALRKRS